jgi:hypothetical protein
MIDTAGALPMARDSRPDGRESFREEDKQVLKR